MSSNKNLVLWCAIILASLGFFADLALAASPDGALWLVRVHSCAGAQQAPTLNERVEFSPGIVTHTLINSASATDYCEEGRTYERQIKTKSDIAGTYTETSILIGQSRRVVCFLKTNDSVESDTTYPLPQGRQSMTVQVMGNLAFANIVYSAECPKGALHFDLVKK